MPEQLLIVDSVPTGVLYLIGLSGHGARSQEYVMHMVLRHHG